MQLALQGESSFVVGSLECTKLDGFHGDAHLAWQHVLTQRSAWHPRACDSFQSYSSLHAFPASYMLATQFDAFLRAQQHSPDSQRRDNL